MLKFELSTVLAIVIALVSFLLSAVLTGFVRKLAVARGMLDVPNDRSSHATPTPRGGGVAMVIASVLAFCALAWSGQLPVDMLFALLGGVVIAWVGFIDDRRGLSTRVRLCVQLGVALWALLCLEGMPSLRFAQRAIELGWFAYVLGVLTIGWSVNLFNFMDGIDGIAGAEAAFVAFAGAGLVIWFGDVEYFSAAALAFGAICCGFLFWNWPRAKIFMGDVGSSFLGYVIAVIAVAAAARGSVGLFVWAILGGVFIVDATVTLLVRLGRRERVYLPHRSHAYQRLSRRWGSHRRVTLAVIAVNMSWSLPLAILAQCYPSLAGWLTLAAFAPLIVIVIAIGAGRPDDATHNAVNTGARLQ